MNRALMLALATVLPASAAAAAPVAMTAMHTESATAKPIRLPRLAKFPDAGIMAKVNAALAAQESDDIHGRADCLAQVKEAGEKPENDTYAVSVDVTYLSARYLSVRDHTNYFCAGAHPDFTDTVLTFDLATGAPINVMDALKPDFVSGGMGKLYAARYRLPKKKDDDACRGWAGDPNNLSDPYARLDAKAGVVIGFQPAHVVAACADDLPLSVADLDKVMKDRTLLADLKATVK
ncbi:MAG: hypothetical protein WDN03_16035 [Rhizomicrobium sp.]